MNILPSGAFYQLFSVRGAIRWRRSTYRYVRLMLLNTLATLLVRKQGQFCCSFGRLSCTRRRRGIMCCLFIRGGAVELEKEHHVGLRMLYYQVLKHNNYQNKRAASRKGQSVSGSSPKPMGTYVLNRHHAWAWGRVDVPQTPYSRFDMLSIFSLPQIKQRNGNVCCARYSTIVFFPIIYFRNACCVERWEYVWFEKCTLRIVIRVLKTNTQLNAFLRYCRVQIYSLELHK